MYTNQSQSYSVQSAWSPDQYDDRDSIPLNGRKHHDPKAATAGAVTLTDDDPFVRDTKPEDIRRRGSRNDDEDGWFKGKITWVVFVLTVAQIIVFIAEIIKNGEYIQHVSGQS